MSSFFSLRRDVEALSDPRGVDGGRDLAGWWGAAIVCSCCLIRCTERGEGARGWSRSAQARDGRCGSSSTLSSGRCLSYETLLATVEQRLPQIPRYRQKVREVRIGMARPVWVDDNDFDITYHVRRLGAAVAGQRRAAARADRAAGRAAAGQVAAAVGDVPGRRPGQEPRRLLHQVAPGADQRHDRARRSATSSPTGRAVRRRSPKTSGYRNATPAIPGWFWARSVTGWWGRARSCRPSGLRWPDW